MTKESRIDVIGQLDSPSDLVVGDRIAFKALRGDDMRMNSSFTFGGIRNGYLLDANGSNAVSHVVFGATISGWDSTEWHVWRKAPILPTEEGSIIYVEELTKSNRMSHYVAAGLAVLRGGGSWQFVRHPEVRFGAVNVAKWSHVNIETIN